MVVYASLEIRVAFVDPLSMSEGLA
jgi:hypothetical protein